MSHPDPTYDPIDVLDNESNSLHPQSSYGAQIGNITNMTKASIIPGKSFEVEVFERNQHGMLGKNPTKVKKTFKIGDRIILQDNWGNSSEDEIVEITSKSSIKLKDVYNTVSAIPITLEQFVDYYNREGFSIEHISVNDNSQGENNIGFVPYATNIDLQDPAEKYDIDKLWEITKGICKG